MSLQDRLAGQDATQLLTTATSLALITAGSTTGFSYNFPLMLFGIVSHEMHSSTAPFRQFLTLVLFTGFFDVYTLLFHHSPGLIYLVSFLLTLLKIPIFFTCRSQLRERGSDLQFGLPAGGFRGFGLPTAAGGGGQSNWSMPQGFGNAPAVPTSQQQSTTTAPPGSFPSSGGFRLGSEEDEGQGHPTPPGPGRGGYQTIA